MRRVRMTACLLIVVASGVGCGQRPESAAEPAGRTGNPQAPNKPPQSIPTPIAVKTGVPAKGIGDYDPRLLLPLAVGNRWVYTRTTPRIDATSERGCSLLHEYEGHFLSVQAWGPTEPGSVTEETYVIIRKDGDHYFYAVTSTGTPIRDNRYGGAVEKCWTWWDKRVDGDGSVGLTDSIKREWRHVVDSGRKSEFLGDREVPKDAFPADDRIAVQAFFKGGRWEVVSYEFEYNVGVESRIVFNSLGLDVVVPAGTFKGCFESIEKIRTRGNKSWDTHTFWAPGVGMVREVQLSPEGNTAYDLVLKSFDLKKE